MKTILSVWRRGARFWYNRLSRDEGYKLGSAGIGPVVFLFSLSLSLVLFFSFFFCWFIYAPLPLIGFEWADHGPGEDLPGLQEARLW